MIVCLCHRVSDRDIRRSVESGVRNFEVLQDETLVGAGCGCCLECAHELFDEARANCTVQRQERKVIPLVQATA